MIFYFSNKLNHLTKPLLLKEKLLKHNRGGHKLVKQTVYKI